MTRSFFIYFILFLFGICACTEEVVISRNHLPAGVMVIDSYAAGLTKSKTRTAKTESEYKISNRRMLVFDSQDRLITSEFQTGTNASFTIDRNDVNGPYHRWYTAHKDMEPDVMNSCKIYIVANLPEAALAGITTLAGLLDYRVQAERSSLHLNKLSGFSGFPMIGVASAVDLKPVTKGATPKIAPIKLETVYAKIVVNLSLRIEQNITGNIPFFTMNKWTVHNIPGYATLGATDLQDETVFVKENTNGNGNFITHAGESTLTSGVNPISNGGQSMEFDFYVLEHRVNPATPLKSYPVGMKENEKQRLKPKWVGENQKPMYIEIEGVLTDHQNHDHKLTYKIYLGENNKDDFHINRNCLLRNNVTIRGISNSQHAAGGDTPGGEDTLVFMDHRVVVDHSEEDFVVRVERETLLDSHFEIRPLDVEIKDPTNSYVDVELVDPANRDLPLVPSEITWVRFEKKNSATAAETEYCSNGKRKYFTTTLLSDLKNYIKTRIDNNEDNRIWVYFDENPNASTDGMRDAMLKFSYYKRDSLKKVLYYKFRQHDLFPVYVDGSLKPDYYIEYYEEYLYNFDPEDPYSTRTEGMKWGDTGVTYSDSIAAVNKLGGIFDVPIIQDFLQGIVDSVGKKAGYYDFEDLYAGPYYTKKLINHGYKVLALDMPPRSAAEYCYNKNKRNAAGEVESMDWYLPAIGEIQDITRCAYNKFEVFHDEFYWSSQTSYLPGKLTFKGRLETYQNAFKYEDPYYARATRTKVVNGIVTNDSSEVYNEVLHLEAKWKTFLRSISSELLTTGNLPERQIGNHKRDAILRVRAVRKNLPAGGVLR